MEKEGEKGTKSWPGVFEVVFLAVVKTGEGEDMVMEELV